jgi:lipid A 3-O-deacylase
MKKGNSWQSLAAITLLFGVHSVSHAADSTSFEFATGNKTQMARVGMQWKWENRWWQSNGTHIGGYWDLSLAQWRGTRAQGIPGNIQNITSFGITPVFRFQNDTLKGFYAEAGVGAHYLSDLYDNNDRKLSTRFEFGDHLGVGYVFRNNVDLGLKVQHFSNGGIKHPNNGVNFALVRLGYPF